ncbi:glutamine-hydrolyzing GMP synthase [Nanoarchaeota archaeon]
MIVILNFGGQYCHLICRRVRDMGIHAEILPYYVSPKKIKDMGAQGIIFSGGPVSVYAKNAPICNKEILNLGIPILGICYGSQLIAYLSGAHVSQIDREYGKAILKRIKKGELLDGVIKKEVVWYSHGDSVSKLPEDFIITGSTAGCEVAVLENKVKRLYGVQFHPEVTHTPIGNLIFKNFIFKICKARKDWDVEHIDKRLIREIKEEVGDNAVLMGISGGVDSTIASILVHKAIKDNLFCVFVDHGMIRDYDLTDVKKIYKSFGIKNFYIVDASRTFLKRLKGVVSPEKKRKIIGKSFIDVFERKAKQLEHLHPNIKYLGQGTIYPDRIESAQPSNVSSKIKSHHNVALPDKMKLKVIEPLKEFYKDEVRKLGKTLGIDDEFLFRHPFPGPGLAVRILGDIRPDRIEMVRKADKIFSEELKKAKLYRKIWQAFPALIPVKTVGVMGDSRTYEYIITLRAVTSIDAMTADWARIPDDVLEKVSNRIINEIKGVNRVLYDISQKPPATIEYE